LFAAFLFSRTGLGLVRLILLSNLLMASTFKETVARDFRKIARDQLETKFSWRGRSYDCTISYAEMKEAAIALGGSMESADVTIVALLEDFPDGHPLNNDDITIGNETLDVISEPVADEGTALLMIRCNRPRTAKTASDGGELVA
jgi:hypothetical protein